LDEYEVKSFECRWKVLESNLKDKYGDASKLKTPLAEIDFEMVGDFLFDLRDRIESLSLSANAWLRKFLSYMDKNPETTRKSPREKRSPNRLESEAMVIANAASQVPSKAKKNVLISQPAAFEITSNSVVEKIIGSVKSRAPSHATSGPKQATSGPKQATSAPKVKLPINRRLTEDDLRTWKIDFDAAFKKKNFKDDPNKNR